MLKKQQEMQLNFLGNYLKTNDFNKFAKTTTKIFWHIFIDGAARGNPGPAGAGIYILDDKKKPVIKKGFYLGERTNNQAEYLALAIALFLLKKEVRKMKQEIPKIDFFSDSELLVKQMKGLYKIKNPILSLIKKLIDTMMPKEFSYSFTHVLRKENTNADKLANNGIDKKNKIPPEFLKILTEHHIPI